MTNQDLQKLIIVNCQIAISFSLFLIFTYQIYFYIIP